MSRVRRIELVVGTLLALLPTEALSASTDFPNHARGLGGVMQVEDLDSISLYNGRLSLSIPIGQSFQVGPHLTYGFKAFYNSNVWDYTVRFDLKTFQFVTVATPSRLFNAGLGWTVTPSRLLRPEHNPTGEWMYVSSDGASHRFYDTLHFGENDDSDDPDHEVSYTRDGSYLRMTKISGSVRIVEFPDGVEHRFEKSNAGPINGTWFLTKMEDRYGNHVDVAQDFDPESNGGWDEVWTYSDSLGRVQYVRMSGLPGTSWNTIEEIDLETVGGGRLVFSFRYSSDQHVGRSCKDTDPETPATEHVSLLSSIDFPDGSSFAMEDGAGQHYYNEVCSSGIDDLSGTLQRLELPTGGAIEWDYQEYEFPPGESVSIFNTQAGVSERRLVESTGAVHGTWTYRSTFQSDPDAPEVYTEVGYPTGDCSKHYFSGWYYLDPNYGDDEVHRGWDLGLPFVWSESESGRYLSTEVYPTTGASAQCTGSPIRSTFVKYDHDRLPVNTNYAHEWQNSNRRLAARRIVHHDDGDRFVDTESSAFDGVGHYRTTLSTTDIDGLSSTTLTRTAHSEFNPGFGVYCYDSDSNFACPGIHTFQILPSDQNWVLGTFEYTELSEPGSHGQATSRREFLFDDDGALLKTRQLAGGVTRAYNDVVVENVVDPSSGLITSRRQYGGDLQPLSTDPGWTLPSSPDYREDYTHEMGLLSSATPQLQVGGGPFKTFDVTRDPHTGVVMTSRTPGGFETSYTYDSLGRLTASNPQAGAHTEVVYSASAPWTTTTRLKDGAVVLSESEIELDDFGRRGTTSRLTADHGKVEATTTFNARGWEIARSVLGYTNSLTSTEYDPFGRPVRVEPADGTIHEIAFSYDGTRGVQQTVNRANVGGSEAGVTSQKWFDGFGRLRASQESSSPAGQSVTTSYSYDVENRLSLISTADLLLTGGSGITQEREFLYDNRGVLLAEKHPETGAGGNDYVYYYDYNTSGQAGRVLHGNTHIRNIYDDLHRPIRTEDVNNGDRTLIQLAYDGGAGFGAGELWIAERHNYRELPWLPGETDVEVTETFSYEGARGELSKRQTAILPMGYSFETEWLHTASGRVATLNYPTCLHSACLGVGPAKSVSFTYDKEQLVGISGWVSSISYHKHGLVDEIVRVNGVSDHINRDGSGIARPKRMKTTGVAGNQNWDSLVYGYDGSGSIKSIGGDSFAYDSVGRLVEAQVSGHTRTYAYDTFGNLGSISTLWADQTFETYLVATDPATNRLTAANYDHSGSVISLAGKTLEFDSLRRLASSSDSGEDRDYAYNAAGDRVWSIVEDLGGTLTESTTLRDVSGRVLRRFSVDRVGGSETWLWDADYIYRGSSLLASDLPAGEVRHFHLDHLGTPRLVTDGAGAKVNRHKYFPFGGEISDPAASSEPLRFTAHERDTPTTGGAMSTDLHAGALLLAPLRPFPAH